MLSRSALRDLLPRTDLSKSDKLLLVLGCYGTGPKRVSFIRDIARTQGAPGAKKWNISDILARSGGCAVRVADGWVLNRKGSARVAELVGAAMPSKQATTLRGALTKIRNPDSRAFVEEAVRCCEAELYRAAVVLSWIGALALVYDRVVDTRLPDFNAEATRRNPKWRAARNADGLARMQESDFLDIIEALGIIGKSVKEELQGCLKFRNGCGHTNSLRIGKSRVEAHIETLALNVFSKFS